MIKKLFLSFVILSAVQIYSQDWRKVTENSFNALSDVYFIDAAKGWAVGSSGEFLQTTDGGATWERPANPVPIDASLYSVFFLDANTGFIGAADETVLSTTDGGASWSTIAIPGGSGSVKHVFFSDASTGWALLSTSSDGQVARTTDGGTSWTIDLTIATSDLEGMDFYTGDASIVGVISGGKGGALNIYYTSDGVIWNPAPIPSGFPGVYTRVDARSVDMVSPTVGYICGWGSRAAGLQPSMQLKTTDGGANWTFMTQSSENVTYVNLYGNSFKDEMNGFAAGGGSFEGTVVVRTTDGGVNYEIIDAPFGFSVKSIFVVDDNVWIVGSGGGTAHSTDFGDTWTLTTETPNSSLYSIRWFTDNFAVASGFYGITMITNDKGQSWRSGYASVNKLCPGVQNSWFVNETTGYLAQKNRIVSRTDDSGLSWTQVMPDTFDTGFINYDVQFLDANTGFVVGKEESHIPVFRKTTDGGTTWSSQVGMFPDHLKGVHFADAGNGCVVGEGMMAYYTTDGGGTWTPSTINGYTGDDDLDQVYFYDGLTGLACGEFLFSTADGGINWNYVNIASQSATLKGCYMFSRDRWIVVGGQFVLETTNGGSDWTDIADLNVITASTIYGVTGDGDGNIWISCGSAEIYTTAPPVTIQTAGELNFGQVEVDSTKSLTLTVNNTGALDLTVTNISNSNAVFTADQTNFIISGGGSHDVQVSFTPAEETSYSDVLVIESSGGTANVTLLGEGVPVVGVEDEEDLPNVFSLSQNFPNPFNPETIIKYSIAEPGLVSLKVYDILGREVAELVNGKQPKGEYEVPFDASELSSGVYIYRLQSGSFVESMKMLLVK